MREGPSTSTAAVESVEEVTDDISTNNDDINDSNHIDNIDISTGIDINDDISIESNVPENIPNIIIPKEIISKNIPPKKTELSVENKKEDFNLYSWKSVDTDTSVIISYLQGRNCVLRFLLFVYLYTSISFLISVSICVRV